MDWLKLIEVLAPILIEAIKKATDHSKGYFSDPSVPNEIAVQLRRVAVVIESKEVE